MAVRPKKSFPDPASRVGGPTPMSTGTVGVPARVPNKKVSTPESTNAGNRAVAARKRFEAKTPGRMKDALDTPVAGPGTRTMREAGMTHKAAYRAHGFTDDAQHSAGQDELPGMTSVDTARAHGLLNPHGNAEHQSQTLPDLAPTPRVWEDMHPNEQHNTVMQARQFGQTPESMHKSFGAQLDQSHMRGMATGAEPHTMRFYSGTPDAGEGEEKGPRQVLKESAKKNGVSFGSQVLTNLITSPKSKFSMRAGKDNKAGVAPGTLSYPNDDAANFAIKGVQEGKTPDQVNPKGHGIIALHGNVRRAANAFLQRSKGTSMADIRNPSGSSPFGPKTGPYGNSWMDPAGSHQFFVSDVHSGGGGMAPSLSHSAPYKRDADTPGGFALSKSGKRVKDSSEREKYLSIPGIHALHDHVARNVMAERGLHSLSGAQAAQWGEEQSARSEGTVTGRKQTLSTLADAPKAKTEAMSSDQFKLF